MRALPSAVTTHLAAGGAAHVHALIWITARNRNTGLAETLGLWTGPDVVVTGGRTYYGAGAVLDLDPIVTDLAQREVSWSFRVSPIDDAVRTAIRVYDARRAPIEVYEWWHAPDTNVALADPVRVFRGLISEVSLPTPALGQDASGEVSCVSGSFALSRGLPLVKSSAALLNRASGDTFRRDNSISAQTNWGSKDK